MKCNNPLIRGVIGDCARPTIKDIELVPRTLPRPLAPAGDQEVLQDEAGFAILDEITGGFIFDDLKA